MLNLSELRQPALRLPGIYCLWLSPSVVNVVTLHSAVGLSPIGWDRIPTGVGAIVSPQAAAARRGVVCLSKMVAALWGMTQQQDPGGYSLSSLPKACV